MSAAIEPDLVDLILCMSKIKRSLAVSKGLHLCNQLINGTDTHQNPNQFQAQQKHLCRTLKELGKVGCHYWVKFLKRNEHNIKSTTPKKITLDRSYWTTFMNFDNMYPHVEEVMIESNIAKRLPENNFMNAQGREVNNERDAVGCKVEVDLLRLDLALVLD